MNGLSIIVPAYMEEDAIGPTIATLKELKSQFCIPVEIIVVDDGSSDRTGEIAASDKDITTIRKSQNQGYGAAIKSGMRKAKYDLIAITDSDGSYPNERLVDMLQTFMDEGADMLVGSRTGDNVTYSKIRTIPKVFMRGYMEWITRQEIPDMNSGLRIFRKDLALHYVPLLPDGFSLTTTITLSLMCNGFTVRYVPIDYFKRIGKSHIQPIRDTLRFFQLIGRTAVYFAPLRFFAPIALVFFAVFLVSLSYDIFTERNLGDKTVLLFTFACNVLLFGTLADMVRKSFQIISMPPLR